MNFNKYMVQAEDNLMDVMIKINKNPEGAMFVCENSRLVGAITDGDIRRHLIKKGNLDVEVKKVCNYNPIFLSIHDTVNYKLFMKKRGIKSLPIVDKSMNIVNIIIENYPPKIEYDNINLPVVIMAGGKGTRLLPYTHILPKPLIPIGEKTITEHIMEHFECFGCNKFDMIVNYKKNFIKSYFIDHDVNKNVVFTEEEEFLGTGGGLKLLQGKYNQTFFMTNCDIIIEANYAKILETHRAQNNIITLVCVNKNIVLPYGIIDINDKNQLTKLVEKPEFSLLTNTGFYVIEPEFLDMIPENQFIHITEVICDCVKNNKKVGIHLVEENNWFDMGQFQELEKMREHLEC